MTQIALSAALHSAAILMRSGRWADADNLLAAVVPADPAEQLALTALRAEVAVDQDFAQATDTGAAALELFEKALTDTPDETHRWDFAMLTLRKTYGTALRSSDQPEEKVAQGNELARRAEALRDSAPDHAHAGHAAFYAGVISDNLRGEPAEAFAHYTTALDLGERSKDQMVISLALRHLGDHAHTAGDLNLARVQWERSTELRQQIGHLLGALAQQALMAVLLKDEGNPIGATALATEINRWSRQVDLPWLTAETAALSGGGSDH